MSQERNDTGNVLSHTKLSDDQHLNVAAKSSAKNNLPAPDFNNPHDALIDKALANTEINTTNEFSSNELITLLNSSTPESISAWFRKLKTNKSKFLDNYFYKTLAAIREKKILPNIAVAEFITDQYFKIKEGQRKFNQRYYSDNKIREIEESKYIYKRYDQSKTYKDRLNEAAIYPIEEEINQISKFKSTISSSQFAEFIILSAPSANELQNEHTNKYIKLIKSEISELSKINNKLKTNNVSVREISFKDDIEKKYTQKARELIAELSALSEQAKDQTTKSLQNIIDEKLDPIKQFIVIRDHLIGNSSQFDLLSIINDANASPKNKFLSYVALFQLAKQGYKEATQCFKNHLKVKVKNISNPTDILGSLILNDKILLTECFKLLPTDAWKERVLDFALANYRIGHIKKQLVDILSNKSNEIEVNDYNKILNFAKNKLSNPPSGSSFRLFVIPDFFLSKEDMIQKGIRKIAATLAAIPESKDKSIVDISQLPKIEIQNESEDSVTSKKPKLVTSHELLKTPLTPTAGRARGDVKSVKDEIAYTVVKDSGFKQALLKIAGFFKTLFGIQSTTKTSNANKANSEIKETITISSNNKPVKIK